MEKWIDTGVDGAYGRIMKNPLTGDYAEEVDYQYLRELSEAGKVIVGVWEAQERVAALCRLVY
jgi:hypothetical protein